MEIFNGTLLVVCLLVALKDAFGRMPEISISFAPSHNRIYIGEKTYVTAYIDFSADVNYKDVQVVFYPSADDPDFVVTRVADVQIGENLKIAGNANPIMDFGRKSLQIPGQARSCQFLLGDVRRVGKSDRPDANVIIMKFEAVVSEDRDEDIGPGHDHQTVLTVQMEDRSMVLAMHQATFHVRKNPLLSMPLLFKSMARNYKNAKPVTEMKME